MVLTFLSLPSIRGHLIHPAAIQVCNHTFTPSTRSIKFIVRPRVYTDIGASKRVRIMAVQANAQECRQSLEEANV